MEIILFYAAIYGVYWLFKNASTSASSQQQTFASPEAFDIRYRKHTIEGEEVKLIEAKGTIPYFGDYPSNNVSFITLLDDISGDLSAKEGEYNLIFSMIESFQREGQLAFQTKIEMDEVSFGTYFPKWATIAVIPLKYLIPPKKGMRKIRPVIIIQDGEKEIWSNLGVSRLKNKNFSYEHKGSGYLDFNKDRKEIIQVSLEMGIALAFSDGSMDETEGFIIKDWIKKILSSYDEKEEKDSMRKSLNKTFKDFHEIAKQGNFSLSQLTEKLNNIGDQNAKYSAIELCYEIMAADGKVAKEEMTMINQLAESLGLDPQELHRIRDSKMKSSDKMEIEEMNIEKYLNIDVTKSRQEIKKELNKEFSKWNSRLNSLEAGDERKKAQKMINLIAEARKKYK